MNQWLIVHDMRLRGRRDARSKDLENQGLPGLSA